MDIRTAEALADVDEPAWPDIAIMIAESPRTAEVLDADRAAGLDAIYSLQVTARSALGAVALNCGGLLCDHRWLRILGAGADGLPGLAAANNLGDPAERDQSPPWLIVGIDALGGRFAIDGGGLGIKPGEVCYWGPDTLEWIGIGGGHSAFVSWALDGDLESFYEDVRWPGWEQETGALQPGQGLAIFPPLFTEESRPISNTSRSPVPLAELVEFHS